MNWRSFSLSAVPVCGAVGLFVVLATSGERAAADISAPGITGGELIHGASELRTRCYQHGTKIVDVGKLDGLNVGALLRDSVLTLKGKGGDGASVIIVPLDETVCVVSAVE